MRDKIPNTGKDGGHQFEAENGEIKKWLWRKRINDSGPIYDPEDAAEIHEEIDRALEDPKQRKSLVEKYLMESYDISPKPGKARS